MQDNTAGEPQEEARKVFGSPEQPIEPQNVPETPLEVKKTTEDAEKSKSSQSFKYKGKEVGIDDVQGIITQAEHLDRLRGELGNRLGQKDKEIMELRESMAELKGRFEGVSGKSDESAVSNGARFQELILENPDAAYEMVLKDAMDRAKAELGPKIDSVKSEVTNTVESRDLVANFYESHPDVKPYKDITFGGKNLVEHAKNDLIARSQTDEALKYNLSNSTQDAFRLLAEETKALAKRLNLVNDNSPDNSQEPTQPNRNIVERGHTYKTQSSPSSKSKESYTADDMRREMLEAHQSLRNRIKPANSIV